MSEQVPLSRLAGKAASLPNVALWTAAAVVMLFVHGAGIWVARDWHPVGPPPAGDPLPAIEFDLAPPTTLPEAPPQEALAEIISAAAPAVPEPAPLPMPAPVLAAPETDEEVDAELLEIFLFEAEEVLQCVHETIPQSRSEPYNQDHLTTLRRSFHTLKGSGRMVGLMAFGEGAWSIEQVLNLLRRHL